MSDQGVSFQELIKQMGEAAKAAADRPTILGGQFTADRLNDFLSVWRKRWAAMPRRIWEHISTIEFANEPREPEFLQRADIFGEGGHLALRRDGNRWLWHFVGPIGQTAPEGFDQEPECVDFWASGQSAKLRRYDESVILWGERKSGQAVWWEDRVAAAGLSYPDQKEGRVYLDFWRYTLDGQTAFIWYRKLSQKAHSAEQGGNR